MSMDTLNINETKTEKNIKSFQPNILVISGGGSKGIAYIGILTALQENTTFDIKNVNILSGSSIGGIISTAICLGYTLEEMKNWFLSTDFTKLCPSIYNNDYNQKILPLLYKSYSLSSGIEINEIITKLFLFKNYDPNTLTFKQLYEITGKLLILSGSNLTSKKCNYFSHIKTPDMKVLTATLITSRIPYVFPHIKYNNNVYIDGHLFDPFPIKGCGKEIIKQNKEKILGIISISQYKDNYINNIKDFTFSIIEGLSYQYMKKSYKKYKKYIIPITLNVEFFTLNISKLEMNEMFNIGIQSGLLYVKNL
jgi:NTE family protein